MIGWKGWDREVLLFSATKILHLFGLDWIGLDRIGLRPLFGFRPGDGERLAVGRKMG
jgi:hypothetical protein